MEAIVAVEFMIFMALPTKAETSEEKKREGVNAAIMASR
jgi:hypothetical protein